MLNFEQFQKRVLRPGSHQGTSGTCAMELISLMVGSYKTENPICVDSVLRHFVIYLNDRLPAKQRQELKPFLPRMINTAFDHPDVLLHRRVYLRDVRVVRANTRAAIIKNWELIKRDLDTVLTFGEESRPCFAFKDQKEN